MGADAIRRPYHPKNNGAHEGHAMVDISPDLATRTIAFRTMHNPDWVNERTSYKVVIAGILIATEPDQLKYCDTFNHQGPGRLKRFTSIATEHPHLPGWTLQYFEMLYSRPVLFGLPGPNLDAAISALRGKVLGHPNCPPETLRRALERLIPADPENVIPIAAISAFPFLFEGARALHHPNCPADLLEAACYSSNTHLREAAVRNPNCPETGRIAAALLGTHSPTDTE